MRSMHSNKVRMSSLSDKEKENALNEVRILASIKNKFVVSYKDAFIDDTSQSLWIIMEFADNGDLFQQICNHQDKGTYFPEKEVWSIFIQILLGLKALHELNIMHRDLKSANVFLYKNSLAKLGDLNVSKVAKEGLSYTQTGTPYYASPEVWKDQPYNEKSDIWSLGWVLYEAIALKPPFRADDMQGLYKKVLKGTYPKVPSQFSPELCLLLKRLLTVNPSKRPSWLEILEMNLVSKKLSKLFPEEFPDNQDILLTTIRCPKNLMYLTDRLPQSCYNIEDSMNGSDLNIKSMHARTNLGDEMKHSANFIGSKKTKATSSTNDSQNMLPSIKKQVRNKISSLSKEHSAILSKRKMEARKKSKMSEREHNMSQDVVGSRINTVNPDDDYENEFDTEIDERTIKK